MRILLVEDDATLAAGIARALRAESFAVDVARNGEDSDHLGATERYDAAVLDLGLPDEAAPISPGMRLTIEDDGHGLHGGAITAALVPGRRLDERGDGHGFGLPIAQELAELNGGELTLDKAPLGGLRVTLVLPVGLVGN